MSWSGLKPVISSDLWTNPWNVFFGKRIWWKRFKQQLNVFEEKTSAFETTFPPLPSFFDTGNWWTNIFDQTFSFFYKITIFHNFCSPSSTGKQIFDQTLLVTNSPFLFTIINWLNISLIRLFVVDNITIFVHHHQLVTKSLIIQWWQHYLFCSPSSYVATSSCLLDKKLNQNYLEPSLVHCRDNVAQHLNALLAPFQMCPIRHSCWRS